MPLIGMSQTGCSVRTTTLAVRAGRIQGDSLIQYHQSRPATQTAADTGSGSGNPAVGLTLGDIRWPPSTESSQQAFSP